MDIKLWIWTMRSLLDGVNIVFLLPCVPQVNPHHNSILLITEEALFYNKSFRLLIFAQRQCNNRLSQYMALAFYSNIIVGVIIVFITPGSPRDPTDYDYWLIIAHPISRLPVFLMGIFAGVLCTRIQEGDTSALNSMIDYLCLSIEVNQ